METSFPFRSISMLTSSSFSMLCYAMLALPGGFSTGPSLGEVGARSGKLVRKDKTELGRET